MQLKYGSKVTLCCIDTDSFVYEIETENFHKDIAKDVGKRFDASGYSKDDTIKKNKKALPIGKNKKFTGMIKDEFGGKIMVEFVALRAKTNA